MNQGDWNRNNKVKSMDQRIIEEKMFKDVPLVSLNTPTTT